MRGKEVTVSRSETLTAKHNGMDQCRIMVNDQQFDAFQVLLDRPAQQNEALERLFARIAPWEADKEDSAPSGGY